MSKHDESYELDLDDTISHWDLLVEEAVAAVEDDDGKPADAASVEVGTGDDAEAGEVLAEEADAPAANDRAAAPRPVKSPDKERLEALEAETKTLRDRLARTLADFDNFRKRAERDKASAKRYALFDVLKDFLDVHDNLERALAASGDADDLKRGVEMIARLFSDLLRRNGAEPIAAVGQPFDPTIHEAVAREEGAEVSEPTVTAELQRGYRLHDRLLRPAMVSVAMPASPATPRDDAPSSEAAEGGAAGSDPTGETENSPSPTADPVEAN